MEPWTQHRYVYVGNSPLKYIDPTGMMPKAPDLERGDQGPPAGGTPGNLWKQFKQWLNDIFHPTGGGGEQPDYYVTPKGDVIPSDKQQFNNNLNQMENKGGKHYGESSNGPVRVRVEGGHETTNSNPGKQNPDHEVPHVHVEHRKNGLTGPWGEGPLNNTSIPYEWLRD